MARLVFLLLAVASVCGVVYLSLKGTIETSSVQAPIDPGQKAEAPRRVESEKSAPKQQIDYYQQKARAIERDTQKRVDDLYNRPQSQ